MIAAEKWLLWRELDKRLNNVLDFASGVIVSEQCAIVRDFIDNREYGVARDWLKSIVDEAPDRFSDDIKVSLSEIDAVIGPG
jgi:hypothetical protein